MKTTFALVALLSVAGCATLHRPTTEPERPADAMPAEPVVERSVASEAVLPEPTGATVEPAPPELLVQLLEPEPPPPEEPQPGEERSESPLDDLAQLEPELAAEEAVKGREQVASEAPTFDIPMVVNEKVLAWVDVYANQREKSFLPGLIRSGKYLPMFRKIYAEHGLPLDLIYMAHVESAYKTSAYSRARARGIFQFMAPTARAYGLRIDYWVDERLDPEKSAHASAKYLKKLYNDFGDWHLVLAAYNAGEGKIRRALARSGRTDFWGIAKTRYIRTETKNHVPAILAATLISKEPEKYGFEFDPADPIVYDTIQVNGAADLSVIAECAGSDVELLQALNPALRVQQTPPRTVTDVHVPVGTAESTLAALEQIPQSERVLYARHRVQRGDSLYEIGRAYGVSIAAIQQANGMGRGTLIRPGQTLTIPTRSSGRYVSSSTPVGTPGETFVYRVRRGDTLSGIARRHGTSAAAIAAANQIHVSSLLRIGDRLTIVPGVRSSSQAVRIASVGAGRESVSSGSSGSAATTHTVRRGENLWRIASRYRTTVDALCVANNISPESILRPGTRLTVR